MNPSHKHRKGFRQDAQMLSEAYSNIHEVKLMGIDDEENNFKVGDWVYDSDGSHASIVSIDGDEVHLYDGKEGWTTHISEIKPEGFGEGLYPKSLGGGGSITSSQKFLGNDENEEGELSDDWMKQDHESRQEERGGDHAKGVKMAIEALGMFKDELHIDGHSEDINVNELADAHDQLSRALHWILDETDVEYITGGRATQKAEADSQPEQFTPMEFPHDES